MKQRTFSFIYGNLFRLGNWKMDTGCFPV